jgi:hypothetical protein
MSSSQRLVLPPETDSDNAEVSVATIFKLTTAFDRTRLGMLDQINCEVELGRYWIETKLQAKKVSTTVIALRKANVLPCSVTHLNACARLAKVFDKFALAHDWFKQEGFSTGWRTQESSGWKYALDVIKKHEQAQIGMQPRLLSRPRKKSRALLTRSDVMTGLKETFDLQGNLLAAYLSRQPPIRVRMANGDRQKAVNCLELGLRTTRPEERSNAMTALEVMAERYQVPLRYLLEEIKNPA